MRKATLIRAALLAALVLSLEVLCRTGKIPRITMVPPTEMVGGAFELIAEGSIIPQFAGTFLAIAIAVIAATVTGLFAASVIHAFPRVRRTLDPFLATYYTVPTLIFYPTLIVLFGLNDIPKVIIAFMHAVVIVITSTLTGLDRVPAVLLKSARIFRLTPMQTRLLVILPAAAPYVFSGVKLGVAYGVVGVVGAEFILSSHGIGYLIAYAFNNLDNPRMYSLMLLVLIIVYVINAVLIAWERRLVQRRVRP